MVIIIEFQNEDKQEKDKAITSKKLEINEEHFSPKEGSECMCLRKLGLCEQGEKVNGFYYVHVKKLTVQLYSLGKIWEKS